MLDAHTELRLRLETRELKSGVVIENSLGEPGESGGKVLSLESLIVMYSSLK